MLVATGFVVLGESLARARLHFDVCAQQPSCAMVAREAGGAVERVQVFLRPIAAEIEPPRLDSILAEEDACAMIEHHDV